MSGIAPCDPVACPAAGCDPVLCRGAGVASNAELFRRSLAAIPYGTTSTYAEQAARLGDAKKARAVGMANGRNPVSIVLPCHRVVGADGSLTGFAGGLDTKRYLLDFEAGRRALPVPS